MRSFIYLILLSITASCGSSQPQYESNTELTVHYNGQLVHKRLPKSQSDYTSIDQLRTLINTKQDFIIIFSSDWCNACKITKKAIKQANLTKPIYYLNVDEPWVRQLMAMMEISSIPYLIHTGSDGKFIKAVIGPKDITLYLLLNYNQSN